MIGSNYGFDVGFRVKCDQSALTVKLTLWDAVVNLRKQITIPLADVTRASVRDRWNLEALIDRRLTGIDLKGRHLVGTFISRGGEGAEFWAVRKGGRVVVLELEHKRVRRLVIEVVGPELLLGHLEDAGSETIDLTAFDDQDARFTQPR